MLAKVGTTPSSVMQSRVDEKIGTPLEQGTRVCPVREEWLP